MRKNIKRNKVKGFTLVELLAVIVILAIVLVIAVPKVMSVIEDSKKATLESTAKMIASQAEKQKVQNTVLGKTDRITCDSVVKINDVDYEDCDITFENNTAVVTIIGSGKFEGLNVCEATKTNAEATDEECSLVCDASEVILARGIPERPYVVKDYDACINYFKSLTLPDDFLFNEGELIRACKNRISESYSFSGIVYELIYDEYFTKEELISNNIVSSDSVFEENNITLGTPSSCVNYTKDVVINEWGYSEEELTSTCSDAEELQWLINDLLIDKIFTPEELIENHVVGSDSVLTNIKPGSSCVSKLKDVVVNELDYTEEELQTLCSGKDIDVHTAMENFSPVSVEELIENNVIKGTVEKKCVKLTPSECFEFSEDTKKITGYDITCGTDVVIPSQIDGVDVTRIGNNAFIGLGITSVILPNSIVNIGNYAFSNNFISTIEIPNRTFEVGSKAFYNNPLTNVKFYNLHGPIGCGAFGDASTITTHNLPNRYESECPMPG